MKTIVLFFLLVLAIGFQPASGQKKYGYAVVYLRCGNDDSQRNTVYYSPVIELNALNFPKYTAGMDPAIPQYSVRYYNYALSKWFEIYLKEKRKIAINDPERYLRKDSTVVFTKSSECNQDKTSDPCFFTDKAVIDLQRRKEIDEAKLTEHSSDYCEIVEF